MELTAFTADFQSSQNYLLEFLLLDTADLLLQSSYRLSCLTVKNHVVEKTGHSNDSCTFAVRGQIKPSVKYCKFLKFCTLKLKENCHTF